MLQKIVIDTTTNYNYVSKEIKEYIKKNINFRGLIIVDYYGKININDNNYIPQEFNNNIVFISSKSFQQNHIILSKQIRRYVSNIIKNYKNLLCIGGESYLYGLTSNIFNLFNITNNKYIYNDIIFNTNYYKSNRNIISSLVDYNNYIPQEFNNCIINISTLNYNLITNINNLSNLNTIIIISCHHDDFWKKIKLLTNYKLISRKKFICYNLRYFITVNILIRKPTFVSLGYNCSVAWNLNKLNIRKDSYPFDWSDISLSKLINVLSNNFVDYEKIEIIKLSEKFKYFGEFEKDIPTFILKNKYNIKFAHEVISKIELSEFSNKLLERIKKFKKLINPIFIRIEKDNINDYNELSLQLDKYFDNYKLIIISKTKLTKYNSIYKHITFNDYVDWQYSNLNWSEIIKN
jgi:hypothetical protein